ncbi:MAG: sensor domain-containing phosphodiesterase [Pseudomonadota bacterium]|nr:sensor domain-containing phosphodiesterase [Pseudomonadota bacterium]
MPTRVKSSSSQRRDSRLRRHNSALMQLTRQLWREHDDLDSALTVITETGAEVLEVERVNVWQFEPAGGLRCVHGYERDADAHNPTGFDEFLAIDNTAYAAAFPRARVIHAADVHEEPITADLPGPLTAYFHRHAIQSLLDAPVHVSGEMYGVICHEHVGEARNWQPDEIAFAGNMSDFVALAVEIERRKNAEQQLDYLKLYDPVSGLGNRTQFHGALRQFLLRMQRRPRLAAVLFVDIDRFHGVNVSAGESGGDELLGTLAERINQVTPDEAVVARVESDCFSVLLPRLEYEWKATRQAEDILKAIGDKVEIGLQQFEISASVGIAFTDGSALTNPEELLRDADLASKQAKERGRNRYEVFDPDHHRSLLDRLQVEVGLREALKNDQLVVTYQPEIDLRHGGIVAAEALVRWRQPDGLRVAGEFIDVAESSGLIVPIGEFVLPRACADAAGWPCNRDGVAPMLRVNLSARQFEDAGLADKVAAALHVSGLDAGRLCLEITETTLMGRAEASLDVLRQLRSLGISLAIDDFGTGYSSLAYLKRFPVDTLKIDRSFIEGLPDGSFDLAIVEAVLGLARCLDIEVVAEGVERLEQERALREHGVNRAQGWLYAAAMEQSALLQRLARE